MSMQQFDDKAREEKNLNVDKIAREISMLEEYMGSVLFEMQL